MKIRIHLILAAAIFSILNLQLSNLHAQGTAFTYQGRLNEGGSPANGIYDLRFTIYDSQTNGNVIGNSLTNFATAVSNGLFTTTIDFGNIFNGGSNWLEIAVSASGSNNFTTLTPRQQIMPVPYAIFANTASNVSGTISSGQLSGAIAATNITGIIADAQLSTNVALLNGNATFSGTITATNFNGNANGLTNVPGTLIWQIISGTNQAAASNTGYLTTNNSLVIMTLPAAPDVGDVVRISSGGAGGWRIAQNNGSPGQLIKSAGGFSSYTTWTNFFVNKPAPTSIASSADGTELVAGAGNSIFTSTDAGMTWIFRTNISAGFYVASSADGTKLMAVSNGNGVYTSTNSGATWIPQNGPPYAGNAIVCSADGTKAVVISGYQVYFSPDSGVDWISRNSVSSLLLSVAMSADGTKLVAGAGYIVYTSTNSAVSWVQRTNFNGGSIYAVASSADGMKLAAAPQNGPIYTSTDAGATWIAQNSGSQSWGAIASSADGTKLVAGVGRFNPGTLYTSIDSGMTWIAQNSGTNNWNSVVISADGSRLAAAGQGYSNQRPGIYISQPVNETKTTSGASGYLLGGANAAVELQYVGGGQFTVISHEGTLFGF